MTSQRIALRAAARHKRKLGTIEDRAYRVILARTFQQMSALFPPGIEFKGGGVVDFKNVKFPLAGGGELFIPKGRMTNILKSGKEVYRTQDEVGVSIQIPYNLEIIDLDGVTSLQDTLRKARARWMTDAPYQRKQ